MQFSLFSEIETEQKNHYFITSGLRENIVKYGRRDDTEPLFTLETEKDTVLRILGTVHGLSQTDIEKIIDRIENNPNTWEIYQTIPDESFIF